MTPADVLLDAARRALVLLTAQIKGTYRGDHEDLFVARELSAAIHAVEQERVA